MDQECIRNFAIVAHIDHGKSTLADRLMEMTGTVAKREMMEQLLDSNPIERERGITIKLAPVRMIYRMPNDECQMPNKKQTFSIGHSAFSISNSAYILNLIDTPGHVDFSYEVSRSLAACEGALLIVDATQGVQAQTLANLHEAREHKLTIIPLINKIDLPNARIEETLRELSSLGFREEEVIKISAKTGEHVEQVLEAIVERIPAPSGAPTGALRALVFSSQYDPHKGVVVFVRVVDGSIGGAEVVPLSGTPRAIPLRFLASGAEVTPIEIGYFSPKMISSDTLRTGEVGYIATGLKDIRVAKVGDTITQVYYSSSERSESRSSQMSSSRQARTIILPLAGYKEPKPMVFVGLYPVNSDDISEAREAMERLRLSDSAFSFRPIASAALGHGFHCGFLGLLHAEIVQERLVREFGMTMIATSPSVEYRVALKHGAKVPHLRPAEVANRNLDPSSEDSFRNTFKTPRLKIEAGLNFVGSPQGLVVSIQSASEFPDPSLIEEVREPVMQVSIYSPKRYVGAIMQLCQEKRGAYIDLTYQADQAEFTYLIPLSEMIIDFFDRLKSITEGYASLDYEFFDYQPVNVAKVDILVNKEKVDALSFLVVADQARHRSIAIVERLADVIPRHQFTIPIQAAIGGDIIARADVKAFRKDVTQKLYGGDRTRKDKLLEAQKKGKARMKKVGNIEIPQNAFFQILKTG